MSVFRISRCNILRNGKHSKIVANFSDDSSNKDKDISSDKTISPNQKENTAKDENNTKKLASKRLNDLLAMMSSSDSNLSIVKDIAKPKSLAEKKERQTTKIVDNEQKDPKSDNILTAARKVAETLSGDAKETESELLAALLKSNKGKGDLKLSSVIDGMTIEKTESAPPFERRSDFVRKSLAQRPRSHFPKSFEQRPDGFERPRRDQTNIQQATISGGSVDLFGGKPLGIFTNVDDLQDSPENLSTWSYLYQRELKLAVTHPPRNYFEKMAIWTDQGKLWKFPIDNEQGMDDEAKNYFTEHVFLEKHLEPWCPQKGPIRHFMELVCVGLSKNPYYTIAQKRELIEWFRDYFAEKKELLESVLVDANASKQLEK